VIRNCDVLIAPRAESAERSLALEAAADCLDGQEIIEHVYPMTRDEERTARCWAEMAEIVIDRCERGQSVAHLTIGDPMLYSTAGYLIEQIGSRLSPKQWSVVPGISALQAAAAAMQQTLARQEDRLLLMPATSIPEAMEALNYCETLALYKVGGRLPELVAALKERGLAGAAKLASSVSQVDKEKLLMSLEEPCDAKVGYMSTVIIQAGSRNWSKEKKEY
jgi:precorrin-2/cobalt-factor-2 C20-methyltransferase